MNKKQHEQWKVSQNIKKKMKNKQYLIPRQLEYFFLSTVVISYIRVEPLINQIINISIVINHQTMKCTILED